MALTHEQFEFPEELNRILREREFLCSVAVEARERVVTFKGFTQGFLYGLNGKAGPECRLPALIQDEATTLEMKKLIAKFAGVPAKVLEDPAKFVELRRIRVASLHILSTFMPDNHARLSPTSMSVLRELYNGS